MEVSPGQKTKSRWINKYKYRDRREEHITASEPIGEQWCLALECFSQGCLLLYSTKMIVAVLDGYLQKAQWTHLSRPLQNKLHCTSVTDRPQKPRRPQTDLLTVKVLFYQPKFMLC